MHSFLCMHWFCLSFVKYSAVAFLNTLYNENPVTMLTWMRMDDIFTICRSFWFPFTIQGSMKRYISCKANTLSKVSFVDIILNSGMSNLTQKEINVSKTWRHLKHHQWIPGLQICNSRCVLQRRTRVVRPH